MNFLMSVFVVKSKFKLWILLVFSIFIAGCAAGGDTQKLPTFEQVKSRVPMKYPKSKIKFPTALGMIYVQEIEVSKKQNLKEVWALINEKYIPKTTQKFWLTNGIRVGVISPKGINELKDTLPKVYASGSVRMTGSNHPQVLLKSATLDKQVALYIPSNKNENKPGKTIHLSGGRMQLLVKLTSDNSGKVFLNLTPHHYENEISLIPKLPLQKQLDGKIYKSLTLRITTNLKQMIVIGLYQKSKHKNKHSDDKKKDSDLKTSSKKNIEKKKKQKKQTFKKDLPDVKPVKPNLGSKLMLDYRYDGRLQKLIFLRLQPMR